VQLDASLGRMAEEPIRCSDINTGDTDMEGFSSTDGGPLLTRGCKLSVRKQRGGSLPLNDIPVDDSYLYT
jgi:hypothetical protein